VSETLNSFLVDLASDPNRMQAFLADPALTLDQTALSAIEKAAILSRDAGVIRTAMGLSPAKSSENYVKKQSVKKKSGKKGGTKKKGGSKKR
jgi:hypothetical protein